MDRWTQAYVYGVIGAGGTVLAVSLVSWPPVVSPVWLVYLALMLMVSPVKLRLRDRWDCGTYSPSFLLVLFGLMHFSLAETLVATCAGAAAGSLVNTKTRPRAVRVIFNMANLAVSVGTGYLVGRILLKEGLEQYRPATMALVAFVYFVTNTVVVSGVVASLGGKPLREVCREWYAWSFPYYLIGAAAVSMIPAPEQLWRAESLVVLLPLLYLLHFFVTLKREGEPKAAGAQDAGLPRKAKLYIYTVLLAGFGLLGWAGLNWAPHSEARFLAFLALGIVSATWKVRLPRITATISVSFVVLLVAIAELSLPEVIVISAVVATVQCVWRPKSSPRILRVLFNLSCLSVSAASAFLACRIVLPPALETSVLGLLVAATILLYGVNTVMVAVILSLTEPRTTRNHWHSCYFWSFPYYLVGAAAAGIMSMTCRTAGWQPSLLILPLMALVCISYRLHVSETTTPEAHV